MKGVRTMPTKKPKRTINDFKDRMTSPVGIVVTTKKSKNTQKGKKNGQR